MRQIETLHHLFFSCTIASVLVTALIQSHDIYWTGQFFSYSTTLNVLLERSVHNALGIAVAFWVWVLTIAMILACLLAVCSRLRCVQRCRPLSGVLEIAVIPLCMWFIEYQEPGVWMMSVWRNVEGCAAIMCVSLYAAGWIRISGKLAVLLLILHTAIWTRVYYVHIVSSWCWATCPIVACLSILVWSYELRLSGRRPNPGTISGADLPIPSNHPRSV